MNQLPAWAQKIINDARRGEGDYRTRLREAESQAETAQAAAEKAETDRQATLDAIAKALGLKEDDTPPDPATLARQLADAQAETDAQRAEAGERAAEKREADVLLAVYRSAAAHGADPDALLDSASFLKTVAGLDPAADDFADRLGEAIKQAVERNERLRKPEPKPAPGRSGTEHTPAPARQRAKSLTEAVERAYRS